MCSIPLSLSGTDITSIASANEVITIEPTTAGTSLGYLASQLSNRPRRFLGIGVPLGQHRLYGTVADHETYHELHAADIHRQIVRWLS